MHELLSLVFDASIPTSTPTSWAATLLRPYSRPRPHRASPSAPERLLARPRRPGHAARHPSSWPALASCPAVPASFAKEHRRLALTYISCRRLLATQVKPFRHLLLGDLRILENMHVRARLRGSPAFLGFRMTSS